ncbi:MAG: zinc ribbon domain-containing protein [Brachymonas sp.]|nr:zinc ribbon domain-containing protein [Brachymonas sp.]
MLTNEMFCNQCGTANAQQARFCSKCGAAMTGVAAMQAEPVQTGQAYVGQSKRLWNPKVAA